MSDHHSVFEEVVRSRAIVKQMGEPAAVLSAKIDRIVAEMHKALQFGAGYKTAQAKLAAAKKAADDQAQKEKTAIAKNDEIFAKNAVDAKNLGLLTKKLLLNNGLKDSKNKATADVISRIGTLAEVTQLRKPQYIDNETYQSHADQYMKYRKLLPKSGGDGLPSEDLSALTGKLDALVKKLQGAAATAKAADQVRHELFLKSKAYDDLKKTVQPLEDSLTQQIGQIKTDLDEANITNGSLDHTGSTEAFQRTGALRKVLTLAIADYDVADAKAWAARP